MPDYPWSEKQILEEKNFNPISVQLGIGIMRHGEIIKQHFIYKNIEKKYV